MSTGASGQVAEECSRLAATVSKAVRQQRRTVAVAESLTSGNLASHLGAAEAASDWFLGGVIAYAKSVKFSLLGVDPGPVVTALCATQMAQGVARLTGADLAVAVTGVGGPHDEEGRPVGSVFIALKSAGRMQVEECHFDGGPSEVVAATTLQALRMLANAATG